MAAGVVGICSIWSLFAALFFAGEFSGATAAVVWFTIYGLFGVATVVGIVQLRSWGWLCVLVWTVILAAIYVWALVLSLRFGPGSIRREAIPAYTAVILFLVWVVATRQRLFFPPKPEREE